MAAFKLVRDWFDGESMHYMGETVEADPAKVPSSAVPITGGKAVDPAGGVPGEAGEPTPSPAATSKKKLQI